MAATFYSGFKSKKSAIDFLLDNIYSGFQMKRSVCVVLKDEGHSKNLKDAQKQKYFENRKIEYLYDDNISVLEEQPKDSFDEIHIFSDKVSNLDEYKEVDYQLGYVNLRLREYGPAIKSFRDYINKHAKDKTDDKIPEGKDVGDVAVKGLKTVLIEQLKSQVANELVRTDWYITRNTEKSTAIPSDISTHRDNVRTKQASMETQILNASDTPALETLYTYTEQEDGSQTRPLGELPTLES